MERLATPLRAGTKAYLSANVVPALTEGLTRLGIVRPSDPYIFLAEFLLTHSPQRDDYVLKRKSERDADPGTRDYSPRHELAVREAPVGAAIQAARALGPTPAAPPAAESLEVSVQTMNQETCFEPTQDAEAKVDDVPNDVRSAPKIVKAAVDQDVASDPTVEDDTAYEMSTFIHQSEAADHDAIEFATSEAPRDEYENLAAEDDDALGVEEELLQVADISRVEEQGDVADTEQQSEAAKAAPLRLRLGAKISGRPLALKATLLEDAGGLVVDALDLQSGERHHLECEGIDYDALRGVYKEDTDLMLREMLRPLRLAADPVSGAACLCF